jgi:hypothetical protein
MSLLKYFLAADNAPVAVECCLLSEPLALLSALFKTNKVIEEKTHRRKFLYFSSLNGRKLN